MLKLYWKKFIKPYLRLVIGGLLTFLIATTAGLFAPLVIKTLIDDALISKDTNNLYMIILAIVILYLLRGIFSYLSNYAFAKAGNKMIAELRIKMYSRLQNANYSFFINTSSGNIIALFTNDLWLVFQAVSLGVPEILVETLNLLAIMFILLYFNWHLAMVTFITVPFIIIAIVCFNKQIGRISMMVEKTMTKVIGLLHQSLISVRIVQSYVREDYEYKQFTEKVNKVSADLLQAHKLTAIMTPLVEFLAAVGLIIIIWYGGQQVIADELTIGGMFAFLIYIINVPSPVRKISTSYTRLKIGAIAWQRISLLETVKNSVFDGSVEIVCSKGVVAFEEVSFAYSPGIGILRDISLFAKPGEVIAIVGPSGAGKSSFANLLLRLFDPTEGIVTLDGVDIKKYTINSLRKHIGFIQQDPILFNTSILENIRYGRLDATFEEVVEAAKQADAHEFIINLAEGYNSVVGELGGLLSGGQRQRIAVARAIIKQPVILLFDEPTAALDAQSEKQVMSAIRKIGAKRTTFIITHRLSTIHATDKVVYLLGGKIIESGTHPELLANGGSYAQAFKVK